MRKEDLKESTSYVVVDREKRVAEMFYTLKEAEIMKKAYSSGRNKDAITVMHAKEYIQHYGVPAGISKKWTKKPAKRR